MSGFYFDYKILGGEKISDAEYVIRRRLQRNLSAKETLQELNGYGGLKGLMSYSENLTKNKVLNGHLS